ncbi:hypothetical protein SKAU_G00135810 [Synaphobranchus kaupii]|uniref:ribonuclease H n=1 Tax=Synaphobranchus kaupii TaxID=118154 RepID=A0A9Q1FR99_SYNKA|nr:hypothetical protein SKAU_G00135810 [Synaphobranchus kaupii]
MSEVIWFSTVRCSRSENGSQRAFTPVVPAVFPQVTLTTPSAVLCGYGNARIELVGALSVAVRYGARTLPSFTFHVSRHGADLMGMDLFSALGFTLLDGAGAAILQVSSPWRQQWPSLFSGLGCLSAFNHQPLLNPDVRPVIQPLRCISLALRNAVSEELQKLLQDGLIEPVNASPWISNLVIAKKKSGGLRVCVDLRAVNKAVIPDKYPLPTVEELTTQFYGATTFSKLDLRQGYLQVPLHPDSHNLTAFVSHAGVFRYARMPFGLSSAPSCFQKIMSTIFTGIPGVVIYLDDIVVHGPTPALNDEHLHQVLTLNEEKCVFSVATVEFVGFCLTAEGLSPLHSNVDAVQRLPEPTCPAKVATFLGMTAYYLRFLRQYSMTTAPLRELLKKDVPWQDPDPAVTEPDLIQMLHTPLQTTVSLQDLQQALEQDPMLSQLRAFILTGWLPKVSEELTPFYRVREELSCWGNVCVA